MADILHPENVGYWKLTEYGYTCSVCGFELNPNRGQTPVKSDSCPFCGARMETEKMKCKRRGYYVPLYSKAMLDRAKRRRIKLFHQRYITGSRVVLMFRQTPARDKLTLLAWCKWGDSHD